MVMAGLALEINNLTFEYPDQNRKCLQNLSLAINEGEKFGLFGPNGAGKTTLMYLMTGLLPIQEGTIKLLGSEMKNKKNALNKLFGFVPQDFSFYHELSPQENLAFFGAWAGMSHQEIKQRTDQLLEIVGLADVKDKQVGQFSGGMKRRVNLAIGVIHQPKILFLDEPTVGVDVQSKHSIIAYLNQLSDAGVTLVYTSHQLSEAEVLCDRVAMIDEGQVIATDTLPNLLDQHKEKDLEGLFLSLTGKSFRD